MKDYRHMMQQVTLSEEKKEEIMEMLEHKGTQKRRMPRAGKFILVAALVVGCMISIAVASDLPLMPAHLYYSADGGSLTVVSGQDSGVIGEVTDGGVSGEITDSGDGGEIALEISGPGDAPLVLEDGRLWFVGDGEHLDVTDLIDENTPFICGRTDPDTGIRGWIIVGGTPDDFGWAEYANMGGGSSSLSGNNFTKAYVTLNGERLLFDELTDEQRAQVAERIDAQRVQTEDRDSVPSEVAPTGAETVYAPWLVSAMEQLGIENY